MHKEMRPIKPHYFFNYSRAIKLLALLILAVAPAACNKIENKRISNVDREAASSERAVDINSASAAELEKIPHIGAKLAQRIIEHREKHGPFRRPENLMLVPGISDERFRRIRNSIKIE